jgi:hypothetical protein
MQKIVESSSIFFESGIEKPCLSSAIDSHQTATDVGPRLLRERDRGVDDRPKTDTLVKAILIVKQIMDAAVQP